MKGKHNGTSGDKRSSLDLGSVLDGAKRAANAADSMLKTWFGDGSFKDLTNETIELHKRFLTMLAWAVFLIPAAWIVYNDNKQRLVLSIAAGLVGMAFGQTGEILKVAHYHYWTIVYVVAVAGGLTIALSGIYTTAPTLGLCSCITVFSLVLIAGLLYCASESEEKLKGKNNSAQHSWERKFQFIGSIFFLSIILILVGSLWVEEDGKKDHLRNFALLGVGMACALIGITGVKVLEEEVQSNRGVELIFLICGLFVEIIPLALELSLDEDRNNINSLRKASWASLGVCTVAVITFYSDPQTKEENRNEQEDIPGKETTRDIQINIPPADQGREIQNPENSIVKKSTNVTQQQRVPSQPGFNQVMASQQFSMQGAGPFPYQYPGMPAMRF